jgi:short-subunit dehydrogenase
MENWRGKWALITGASAGIGRAFAFELAAGGTNLILTARRLDRLNELADELRAKHKIVVEVCIADLAEHSGPAEVFEFTSRKGYEVELLINNAGFGVYGEFAKSDLSRELEMVQVNIASVVHLTRLYLPPMITRRHGDILILASTAAFQGVPYLNTYSATKAFDLHFAEALAEEVKQFGIRVCALCPGSTTSEFSQVAGQPANVLRKRESAEKVAHVGLKALAGGKSYVISGWKNFLGAHAQRLLPRRVVERTVEKAFRPKNGKHTK